MEVVLDHLFRQGLTGNRKNIILVNPAFIARVHPGEHFQTQSVSTIPGENLHAELSFKLINQAHITDQRLHNICHLFPATTLPTSLRYRLTVGAWPLRDYHIHNSVR